MMRLLLTALVGGCSLLAAALGVSIAVHAWWLAGLPYTAEGNHFDGLVTHHAGAQFVYAAIALLCLVVAIVLCRLALALARRRAPG